MRPSANVTFSQQNFWSLVTKPNLAFFGHFWHFFEKKVPKLLVFLQFSLIYSKNFDETVFNIVSNNFLIYFCVIEAEKLINQPENLSKVPKKAKVT